jgi:hypothetical protein
MTPQARRAWLRAIAAEHAGPDAAAWLAEDGGRAEDERRAQQPAPAATERTDARRASRGKAIWRVDTEGAPEPTRHEPHDAGWSTLDGPAPPNTDDTKAAAAAARAPFDERIPTLVVGLALAVDGAALAAALRPHFARFPGFHWEIEALDGLQPSLADLDVVVCPESANALLPHAVTDLRETAEDWGLPLLFLGTPLGRNDDADPLEGLPARVAALFLRALIPVAAPTPRGQWALPFPTLTGRDLVRLPPAGPTVAVQRLPRGVRLEARYDDGATRSVSVELGEGGAVIRTTEPGSSHDALRLRWFASTPDAEPGDLFESFADAIAGPGLPCRALLDPLVRRARVWMRQAVPRTARSAACAFHPRVAGSVAMRAAADTTGRVAQLARVCPGLFALGVALRASTALDEACARTIAGRPLADCLEPVLEAWRRAGRGPRDVARHASFVKRAPAAIDPTVLRAPFPPRLILDDLPEDEAARTAWFTAAGALAALTASEPAEHVARLASFVSARGEALGRLDEGERNTLLIALLERGRALGHWPSRRTQVPAARARAEGFSPDAERVPWRPTLTTPSHPLLHIRLLATPAALAAEGQIMGHCVGTYVDDVLSRTLLVFAVRWRGKRYTASAEVQDDDRLLLSELEGRVGEPPPPPALRVALLQWLARQRVDAERARRAREGASRQ